MSITGIDRVTFGVEDVAACKTFFLDFGLKLVTETAQSLDFETLNGCELRIRHKDDPSLPPAIEEGSTAREVIWSAESEADLDHLRPRMKAAAGFREDNGILYAVDPNGLTIGVRRSHKRAITVRGAPTNT
jgi:catechol 2,3-dioxygenase-like lactoylglutathione lyase family enzyme